MKLFSKYLLSSLLILTVVTMSCSRQKASQPEIYKYIAAYTEGVIKANSTVSVYLSCPLKKEFKPGTTLPDDILKLSPNIKGQLLLKEGLGNSIVEFVPNEPFPNGQTYEAALNLGALCDVPKDYQKFTFSFSIIPLGLTFEPGNLQVGEDETQLSYQASIYSSDYITPETVEKKLSAAFDGKSMPIVWQHENNNHQFTIAGLAKGETVRTLKLVFAGDVANGEEMEINVPGIHDFSILNIQIENNQPLTFSITMSEKIDPAQNLNGLVTIRDFADLNYKTTDNVIYLYPEVKEESTEYEITVHKGIRSISGNKFDTEFTQAIQVPVTNPQVKFIGKGSIVPTNGKVLIPFSAVNLKAVDVQIIKVENQNMNFFLQTNSYENSAELRRTGRPVFREKMDLQKNNPTIKLTRWNDFTIDLGNLVQLDKGVIYRVEIKFRKSYTTLACADEGSDANISESDWDNPGYYYDYNYPDGYEWNQQDNPCHVSYYTNDHFISKNIINTSLGIMAKRAADGKYVVCVNNLETAEAVSDCEIIFYNFQNQQIGTAKTDGQGFASSKPSNKAFIVKAQKGNDQAWLKVDDGSALSLSNFDVSGQNIQNGIKGFIYGERGVWRPGDEIYLSFILEDKLKNLPTNHPVIAQLTDPKGNVIQTRKSYTGDNNIYAFTFKTTEDAPTGYWNAVIRIGGVSFNKTLRIETVKPNRLSIDVGFPDNNLIGKGTEKEQIPVKTRWLHGAKTPDLKAVTEVRIGGGTTTFKGFPGYIFDDKSRFFEPNTEIIFDGKTDAEGNFTINTGKIKAENAPGVLNASFTTRIFENSGDFSISSQTVKYSPYTTYVGIRLPESEDGWYSTTKAVKLSGVVVNTKGNKVSGSSVDIEVYKLNWRWWWDSEYDNAGSYVNSTYNEPVFIKTIPATDGTFTVNLNLKEYGRYFIRAKDKSGHTSSLVGWFGSWADNNNNETATMLNISSDKKSVKTGEKIRLNIPSAEGAIAIVSLENGKTIKDIFRVPAKKGSTTIEIDATSDMCPNIYAHITLIQPVNKRNNDRPVRLYGVVNINVEDPALHLNPQISAPQEIRPAKEFTVKVSETNGKPMNYTLAVVDEGLLSLTAFKTPDPFSIFYAREALGIKTWDFYDFIFGAYGARLDKAFAVGGDEALKLTPEAKTNRFKPVVIFKGPFTLKKGETATHKLQMPEYIGEVRTMVIAAQDGKYGSASASTKVVNPLMVNITMPRLFTPGDMIDIPVTVFAMNNNIRDVNVSLTTNNSIEIIGQTSKTIRFSEQGEKIVTFKTRIKNQTGTGEIKAQAQSGNEQASVSTDVTIRVPNPRITRIESKALKAGESINFNTAIEGAEPKAILEVSSIPPMNLEQRLDYLITYPHGCAEQITSAVFPQLSLNKLVKLSAVERSQTEAHIVEVINRLQRYQTTEGGFAYWAGESTAADWVSSYVSHFLISAQKKGYTIPGQMMRNATNYLKQAANEWRASSTYYNSEMEQAYRLYVLTLCGNQDMAAMNRLKERQMNTVTAQWLLAGAYALTGHQSIAENMIRNTSKEVKAYRQTGGCYGSDTRDYAIILEVLLHLNKQQDAYQMLEKIARQLASGEWMSTQTIAFSLLGASDYVDKYVGINESLDLSLTTADGKKQLKSDRTIIQLAVPVKGSIEIKNNGRGDLTARLIGSSAPYAPITQAVSSGLTMTVRYVDKDGNALNPDNLKQGQDITTEITVKNTGITGNYEELALCYLVPSGFEILNERLADNTNAYKNANHTDIRDDRFYLYFDLNENSSKTFRLRCNAAYAGEYLIPAIECSAMYDNNISAILPGGKAVIHQ